MWYNPAAMPKERPAYQERIIHDPKIMAGKPVVKGTRIPVERVIRHMADNPSLEDLFQAFPHLTIEDVKACLAYAYARLEAEGSRSRPTTPPARHVASA